MRYVISATPSWQNKQLFTQKKPESVTKRQLEMLLVFAFHCFSLMQVFTMARDGVGCTITDIGSIVAMVTWIGATAASFALLCALKPKPE